MARHGFNFDNSYAHLAEPFYTRLVPESVDSPSLVILNEELAAEMGLDLAGMGRETLADMFAGHRLPDGSDPIAQAYAGHQFGHFTMLGDGRAIVWGEHLTPDGRRLDIQFKGSGRTPYSRGGDGRAALGPMLREYIISEAMHALGIPTTRSLAVVETGERVMREEALPGAILTRVAASHIRVGTFEYVAALQDKALLHSLLDYTVERHDPDLIGRDGMALAFIEAVMERQASLIAQWMRVGFIHGVMNTDNMTISGETIDYGPCAFMDEYHPDCVFSSIDRRGRYAFANQPGIARWNLSRLAEALLPLIDADVDRAVDMAEERLQGFPALFSEKWLTMMRAKLGLTGAESGDDKLATDLLEWMQKTEADYTNTFLALMDLAPEGCELPQDDAFGYWQLRWQARRDRNTGSIADADELMRRANPQVIPRNHRVDQALTAAETGEFGPFRALLDMVHHPYEDRAGQVEYQSLPLEDERIYQTFCGT